MTIAIGKSTAASGSTSTSTALTTSAVTTQATGSTFVIFCIAMGQSGTTFQSITDSKGNTYTLRGTQQNNASDLTSMAMYECVNGSGGASHTASFKTATSLGSSQIHFIEITGGKTAGIDDQTNGVAAVNSPYACPVTTTQPNELVLNANIGNTNTITFTANGGFSNLTSTSWSATCYRVVTTTGTYDPAPTITGSSRSSVITASFIQDAAGGGTVIMGQACL